MEIEEGKLEEKAKKGKIKKCINDVLKEYC